MFFCIPAFQSMSMGVGSLSLTLLLLVAAIGVLSLALRMPRSPEYQDVDEDAQRR